jgi:hypothetical protein
MLIERIVGRVDPDRSVFAQRTCLAAFLRPDPAEPAAIAAAGGVAAVPGGPVRSLIPARRLDDVS